MSTLTTATVNSLLKLWNVRGQQIANSVTSLFQLSQSSPVDISSIASAAMLLAQAYTQAQIIAGEVILSDPIFATLTIESQDNVYELYTSWLEFGALLGSVAFQEGFPVLDSITQPTASSRLFGAITANPSTINIELEAFLSVPTLVGITPAAFWQLTTLAREQLSQVITVDLTLNSSLPFYDFADAPALVNTVIGILTNMVPLTINVPSYLNQINKFMTTGLQTTSFNAIQVVTIAPNSTIDSISLAYTGSADNWEQIVTQNNLTYPYITSDPTQVLGSPLITTVLLQSTLNAGTNTIIVGNVQGIYQNCKLLLKSGNFYDIITVQSVGPVNVDSISSLIDTWDLFDNSGTITATSNVLHTYVSGDTTVELFLTNSDQGAILTTGDTLLVPTNLNTVRQTNINSQNNQDAFSYGTDLQISQGNLTITNGDLTTISGVNNVVQAIGNAFATPQRTLVEHPNYGNSLETFIGIANSPFFAALAAMNAIQTALSDPRIQAASSKSTSINGDQLNIDLNIALKNGTTLSPVRLSTPVTFGAS